MQEILINVFWSGKNTNKSYNNNKHNLVPVIVYLFEFMSYLFRLNRISSDWYNSGISELQLFCFPIIWEVPKQL